MIKPHRITCFWLSVAIACSWGPAWSQVYKWVDEDGRVHYSDKKPPESESTELEVVEEQPGNVDASGDDGVDVEILKRDRERRERQREIERDQRLRLEAERFRAEHCYEQTETVRRGTSAGGSRVVGTQDVKRCRQAIPTYLQPYLSGFTTETD